MSYRRRARAGAVRAAPLHCNLHRVPADGRGRHDQAAPNPCRPRTSRLLFCSFASAMAGRPNQQVSRFYAKDTGQSVNDIDTRRINASLKRTDVGAVDPCAMSKFLLRQASRLSQLPQIESQHISYLHAPEITPCRVYNHGVFSTNTQADLYFCCSTSAKTARASSAA